LLLHFPAGFNVLQGQGSQFLFGFFTSLDIYNDINIPQFTFRSDTERGDGTRHPARLPVEVNIEGKEPYLTENVRLSLFRVAQEAISNTRKHAQASRSVINLGFQENRLSMSVRDDGNGFDIAEAARRARGKGSLGLLSMQERARLIGANLKIDSKPGQGTVIQVDLPL